MKDIHFFFNQLRIDDGAIWLENKTIKLSTSKKLQNEETRNFVINNKAQIISILEENKIFSKEDFLKVLILKDNISNYFPLSPAQERLWFIEQYEQGSNAYHIPAVFELDADTNIAGIKYAVQKIISRHEILRTTIEQVDNQEHGTQRVHDKALVIEEEKLTGTQAYKSRIAEDINHPFDLSSEYPVRVKFYIVQPKKAMPSGGSKKVFLLINIHHIATDGWSIGIFEKELLAYYEAFINNNRNFRLPAPGIQYKDYALWQRAFLMGPILEKQLAYWKKKLANYHVLEMPADLVRPARVDYKGSHEKFTLSKEISRKLRVLAKLKGATLHSVLLSSIHILLHKYTGQDDIVIGSPIANRHHRETESLIGFFVNMQVNRSRLNGSQNYEELVQKVHQEQVQAQLYQDLPFEKLVDELKVKRDSSRHPIFQVMFAVQNFGNQFNSNKKFPFTPFQPEDFYEVEKFDLSFYIDDSQEKLKGQISYATSLFHKDTILRLIAHYRYLLDQLIEDPGTPYGQISLLNLQEYEQVICEWNKTSRKYPNNSTIYQLFEKQVEKDPVKIALVYEGWQVTYGELNEKSNQLARHIRMRYRQRTNKELAPDTLIALFLDRTVELVIAILAILKAGGAYVPIDIDYPRERVACLLDDTKAEVVLSRRQLTRDRDIQLFPDKIIYTDLSENFYKEEDTSNLPQHSKATDLAYVIYTSGSTGKPKGVMVEQVSVVSLVFNYYIKVSNKDVFAFLSSPVFDASTFELWTPLLNGNTLVILKEIKSLTSDSKEFSNFLSQYNISILWLTTSLFESLFHLNNNAFKDLNYLITGGEALDKNIVDQLVGSHSKPKHFLNGYGPTESTTFTCMYNLSNQITSPNVPIGTPIKNRTAYVLYRNLSPVPIGVIGELYIGGAGLARGYLNRKELTELHFIPNPFATKADKAKGYTRLYKTGDLVKWLPDGNLEYIGRKDDQVKIRGFRIELGEIEHALSQIPGIRQSCVLVKERKTEYGINKYLVGYYVPANIHHALSQTIITNNLRRVLPEYMVPGTLVAIGSFPLTTNGKLDKLSLPDPELNISIGKYVAPTSEKDIEICDIWKKVLGLEKVGITDNFFRIGGNSIVAIQVAYRMSKALGYKIKIADVFRLRSIDKILAIQDQYSELIKPYHLVQNKSLHNLVFIHPGHGGSEVYQDLADTLSANYNCIGIDNYNLYHEDKIGSLNTLAQHYLQAYEKNYIVSEPVNLLGWSLGGQVALEIAAILEARGVKNINVFLLDTLVGSEMMLNLNREKNNEYFSKKLKNKMPVKFQYAYLDTVASAFETEKMLANSPITGCLQYARVVLFKAIQREEYHLGHNKKSTSPGKRFKKLPANNVDLVAANVEVIDLNCYHENILDTNSATISNYILSKQ